MKNECYSFLREQHNIETTAIGYPVRRPVEHFHAGVNSCCFGSSLHDSGLNGFICSS